MVGYPPRDQDSLRNRVNPRVQIIGCGMVGSSIANELINTRWDEISELRIVDIDQDRLRGEYYDLKRVIAIKDVDLNLKKTPFPGLGYDISIITMGQRCRYDLFKRREDAINDLFTRNWPSIFRVVDRLRGGRIIIVTNPADMIARTLRKHFPKRNIVHAGDFIDEIHDGKEIHELKGFTNWGIAAEVGGML